MECDDNTKEIAYGIFTKPPCAKNTHQLYLEESTMDMALSGDQNEFINEVLYVITSHGLNILFNHNDINKLTEKQIDLVKEYVASYGYVPKLTLNKIVFEKLKS